MKRRRYAVFFYGGIMEYKRINDVFVVRLDVGDEIITSLTELCNARGY